MRLDLSKLRVLPLAQRRSLSRVEDILIEPASTPPKCRPEILREIQCCAERIRAAKKSGAAILLIYGAHLLRNGAALLLERLMAEGWLTHLATNGAGSIHDWEYAYLGRSTENVAENVAAGTFGSWDETGRYIHLALMAGALENQGYGVSLGRFIFDERLFLPEPSQLAQSIREQSSDPLTSARADLLQAMNRFHFPSGCQSVPHRWKQASILAQAFHHRIPLTVHPGIGYDIISNHPIFNGAVIGRAAAIDFQQFGAAVERLDHGVVLSIGSAIMGPQVFEKSLSCVHNLRFQQNRPPVQGHSIFVVDLQEGGHWDWRKGEPPKNNAAYYLRFCKSFSRMGGEMRYLCCDNALFLHHLYSHLRQL